MSIYLFITVLSVLATVALTASSSEAVRHVDAKSPTGSVMATLMYYLGADTYTYNLVAIDYKTLKWTIVQELLPKGLKTERNFESFTTYHAPSRTMFVAAMQHQDLTTFWKMTVSNDAASTTFIYSNVDIKHPISQSPFPLNVAPLQLARVFTTSADQLIAVFSNGEVHEVDLERQIFLFKYKLMNDDEQLSVQHPTSTYAHAHDASTGIMHSICFYGSLAYYKTSDLKEVKSMLQMKMPGNMNGKDGFSPQTFTNLHLVKLDGPDAPASLLVVMESLHNVGFDQLTLLNTTTGELGQLVTNLMDYDLEFSCQDGINACDLWRVTAWDAANSIMYFQAHSTAGDNVGEPMLAMMGVDHTQRGKLSWYVNTLGKLQFGLSGFQFVEFK